MLAFFHRYQRFFFIFVTVMVVSSFAFFGVFDALSSDQKIAPDRKITEAVDGSAVMLSSLQGLSRMIASDCLDVGDRQNLCNDGVVRNDILKTGICDLLVGEYFDSLKDDFQYRLDRAKRFKGYENPQAAFISARAVWDRFMPAISHELDALQAQDQVSIATFSHLLTLYEKQMLCPPEFVKKVLMYYSSQASWMQPDPYLSHYDLSLFGFHSIADWFGSNFIDLSAQFILNGAKVAQSKGYQVSLEEAKSDLEKNFLHAAQNLKQSPKITWDQYLRSRGFDVNEAAESWRLVLLFRRYFQGVGNSSFTDQLVYRDFASFARESSVIDQYEWPEELRLKTGDDLVAFQAYIQAIGGSFKTLSLPANISPLKTIEEKTPNLVQASYKCKIAQVSLEEIGLRASMKQLLEWQLDLSHWELLTTHFSFLHPAETKEERFACLDSLSTEKKIQLDLFSRLEWAKENRSAIDAQLREASAVETEISLSSHWISLPTIQDPQELCRLIDLASMGDEDAKHLLEKYSDTGRIFYRFESIEKIQDFHVLTFKEAKALGIAKILADAFLEKAYQKMGTKGSEKKPLSSMKEEVALFALADLIHAIGKEGESLAYYAQHRLEKVARQAKEALQKQGEDSKWLAMKDEDPLTSQFKLEKSKRLIHKTTKDEWMKEQLLMMSPNQWSNIYVPSDGDITFFYFEKKEGCSEPILEQILMGREVISSDAKRYVAQRLLTKFKKSKSIVIPIYNKEIQ
jgi:hypothetical protein